MRRLLRTRLGDLIPRTKTSRNTFVTPLVLFAKPQSTDLRSFYFNQCKYAITANTIVLKTNKINTAALPTSFALPRVKHVMIGAGVINNDIPNPC